MVIVMTVYVHISVRLIKPTKDFHVPFEKSFSHKQSNLILEMLKSEISL